MTFGSLFSGIGGMDLGLERAGMTCKWQVEIDPFCQKVLTKHWPGVPKYGDIREVTGEQLGHVDLIAGGFPCQDLSVAGLQRGIQQGNRSGLWIEYARLIGEIRPRFVLIENVSGLLANEPMRRVLGDLSALGFDAEWESIPAAAVGAPHIRDRVFILADSSGIKRHGLISGDMGRNMAAAGDDRETEKRRANRKLINLVPGIHPGVLADWWGAQSSVARSTHGVPCRVERIKSLGNAVVPQVAAWIGRRIMEASEVAR